MEAQQQGVTAVGTVAGCNHSTQQQQEPNGDGCRRCVCLLDVQDRSVDRVFTIVYLPLTFTLVGLVARFPRILWSSKLRIWTAYGLFTLANAAVPVVSAQAGPMPERHFKSASLSPRCMPLAPVIAIAATAAAAAAATWGSSCG